MKVLEMETWRLAQIAYDKDVNPLPFLRRLFPEYEFCGGECRDHSEETCSDREELHTFDVVKRGVSRVFFVSATRKIANGEEAMPLERTHDLD